MKTKGGSRNENEHEGTRRIGETKGLFRDPYMKIQKEINEVKQLQTYVESIG